MDKNTNRVPDTNATPPNNKPALPAITPSTKMEALEKYSDESLENALRCYRKSARKNRSYRHICRLIKAEQKRRSFPVFAAVNNKGGLV